MRRSMDERRPHCMVEGAGMAECNGMYRLVRSHQDSPWTMQFKHVDNPSIKIVRCLANGQYGWVIGQEGKAFYGKRSDELIPPQRGWRKFKGTLPRPTVTLRIKDDASEEQAQGSGIELTSMVRVVVTEVERVAEDVSILGWVHSLWYAVAFLLPCLPLLVESS